MELKYPIPHWNLPIVDTHCHLDYLEEDQLLVLLQEARNLNIEFLVTIAVDPKNQQAVYDIANKHEMVYCSQGIHPHDSSDFNLELVEEIKARFEGDKNRRIVAIGEIGLDYHYMNSDREQQIAAFETQLELSSELQLPVIIHSREAEDDTISVLKNALASLKKGAVIHSFTSHQKLADFALENGLYLGLNGIVTFTKAQNIRDIFQAIPLTSILLETDAPYLTPAPYRGHPNTPLFVPFVARELARVHDRDIEDILLQTTRNARSFFDLN